MRFLCDAFIGVYYGDWGWNLAVWTISIELKGTFVVYMVALTAVHYSNRVTIYALAIIYYLFPFLI